MPYAVRGFALALCLLATAAQAQLNYRIPDFPEATSGYQAKPGWPLKQRGVAAANPLASDAGYRRSTDWPETHDVGGVLLARPFKISRIGPVRLLVEDIEAAVGFYRDTLGLALTESVEILGQRCYFLRANTEHHALALYPEALRGALGLGHERSLLGFGMQLGSYAQLRAAVAFLGQAGYTPWLLPQALSPGLGHHVWLRDPDGNAVQLEAFIEMCK